MTVLDTFWLLLALKMASAALLVVMATTAAERAGPFWGALIASLPVSAGPIYVLLALEHGPDFIADSAVASLAAGTATAIYMLTLARFCPAGPIALAIGFGLVFWLSLASALARVPWTLAGAAVVNIGTHLACFWLTRDLRRTHAMRPVRPRWYDVPARALLVAGLVVAVSTASHAIGPQATGFAAVFPIVMTSLALIMHVRLGGQAVAAIMASAFLPLVGFNLGLVALHLTAPGWGSALGLAAGLAACIAWSAALVAWRFAAAGSRRGRRSA